MFHLVMPHILADSVLELTVDRLRELGIDALLLDVDCTLKSYRSDWISGEVANWLKEVRSAGIRLCLVSNGRGKRIGQFARKVNIPFWAYAWKPFPHGCREAVANMGFDPKRTALVGDQLFADVVAARWAGLTSILVRPIRPEEEPWYTRLKRPLEALFLRWMRPRLERRQPSDQAAHHYG